MKFLETKLMDEPVKKRGEGEKREVKMGKTGEGGNGKNAIYQILNIFKTWMGIQLYHNV